MQQKHDMIMIFSQNPENSYKYVFINKEPERDYTDFYVSVCRGMNMHMLEDGGRYFCPETLDGNDIIWLAKDYNGICFKKDDEYIEEYAALLNNPYYREKLTPRQIIDAINAEQESEETQTFYDEFNPEDRLKYLTADTYRIYKELGDELIDTNINQAYLCYENAMFLCDDPQEVSDIRNRLNALYNYGTITVNKTAFVIISYNNLFFTQKCLESIYTNCNLESCLVMVFDNGSTDGSREWLNTWAESHDEAVIILNDTNLGFAGGNNACCQYLPEGYDVFYLNNDTRIPANALFWMRMALYSADDVGGVGAVQNYAKGDQLADVCFDLPEQYVEYGAKRNVYESNPYEEQSKICGFAMLITRQMYEITGGFDEQFNPGFLEDDDLSLQIRSLGRRLILCQNAFIYHAGSQSFRKRDDVNELFRINREKCIRKWGFNPTVYAAMSENEYAFCVSLAERGYNRDSIFSLVHIGSGCGNMLGHIHYLYPNAILAGVEENEIARHYAISCISVCASVDDLPMPVGCYDHVVEGLG